MNKWVAIAVPIIGVLAIGAILLGVFYLQETGKLEDAQAEIVTLEENVSALSGNASSLETELAAAQTQVSTLEADLAAAGTEVSTLEADLATAEAKVSTLEADLADIELRISALEIELPVTFPDAGLEAAIREAIEKPEGPIYKSDLNSLTILSASSRGISDLAGLGYFVNLETLWLGANFISDLSPLAGLTNLVELILGGNFISDLSPLAGLTNLKTLNLGSNSISDISALTGLTGLEWLGLRGNNISDLSPLVANSGFATGDTVDVRANPWSTASENVYIPQLIERGVAVRVDAPQN